MYYVKPAGNDIDYINIAKDQAEYNSKNEEITTRDGHVYGYLCRFKVQMLEGDSLSLYTAPNSWKMRNSFRKFHAYRNHMFAEAGIEGSEMGRYGRTIRPLLDTGHKVTGVNTLDPVTPDSTHNPANVVVYDKGEWDYTQLATTPIYETVATPSNPTLEWADAFHLKICEENIQSTAGTDQSSGLYTSVGMIHSYNLDRMEIVTPDKASSEVVQGPSNPLAALRASGNQAAGHVLELAAQQESELPPYDQADDGTSIYAPLASIASTPSTGGTVSFTAFLPAGLGRFYTSSATAWSMHVEVLGKVLCKDMA